MIKFVARKVFVFWCVLFLVSVQPLMGKTLLKAESAGMAFEVEQIIDSLGVPWGMVFLNREEILFTERGARPASLRLKMGLLAG